MTKPLPVHGLRAASAAALLAALTPAASAQLINVDIGGGSGTPLSTYAADGPQAGFWNAVPADAEMFPLRDANGQLLPGVTITIAGGSEFTFDHPQTSGGDAALFDDLSRASGGQTITLQSSQGALSVEQALVYCWAPDDATALTSVRTIWLEPFLGDPVVVGGDWEPLPGDRWGKQYAWSRSDSCAAPISLGFGFVAQPGPGSTTTSVNGFQLFLDGGCGTFCNAYDEATEVCPCGERGRPVAGCDTPQGTGGVQLRFVAQSFAPNNRATLQGTGFPTQSSPAGVLLRNTTIDAQSPVVFGDGLRCVDAAASPGTLVRLAAAVANGGVSTHVAGHGMAAGTGEFAYQLWYRSSPASYCDPTAAFNLSNGLLVSW